MKATAMEQTTNQEELIFLDALELDSDADRHEFLKNKCGNDNQLQPRGRVVAIPST